jgi:multidrug efflux pump subunit AcrA (membrane-fusion protein)
MAHVQVLQVQPTSLTRTLRLTGAVAYNSFHTTPVITQVSGPVSRVVVVPGQRVERGQPMLYVASPDYSQSRTNYLKAKDAYALAQKAYARAKDLYDHHAIAEQNLEQAESAEVQAGGDLAAAEAALKVLGISDPDALVKAPPSFEVPVRLLSAAKWLSRMSRLAIAAAHHDAVLPDFRCQHGVGVGQRLSEGPALRARWAIQSRFRPRLIPTSSRAALRTWPLPWIRTPVRCRRALRPAIPERS